MLKKTIIAGLTAAALGSGLAQAQQPASPHPLTGNVGFFSQYIFRGLTRTNSEPALQGGFDYNPGGFYLGTWGSNISWLRDFGTYSSGGSMEWDFYGGYKNTFGKSDFGYDVGALQYWYPGTVATGANKADTLEVYGALSWKWLSAKLSYALSDKVFGVTSANGTTYLDLSANIPLADKFALQVHYGDQKFTGNSQACFSISGSTSNDSCASYTDWKIGVSYSLPKDFTVGAFYTDTSMNSSQKKFYTTPNSAGSRFLGNDTVTLFIQKSF